MKHHFKHKLLQGISIVLLLVLLLVGCDGGVPSQSPITEDGAFPVGGEPMDQETGGSNGATLKKKRVALTFDDGPHNVYTRKIVDELARYGAHATFFVVGNRVDGTEYNGRSGLQYAIENGNEIGIHGYTHKKYYNRCTDEEYHYELSSTLSAIRAVSATTEVKLMRPIGGAITDSRVEDCPYAVIMWNVDSEDWKNKYSSGDSEEARQAKAELIANRIISTVKEDSIILMHDIYESTYDALVRVLAYLYSEGYEVVTVSELLGNDLHSGEKYYSGK